MGFADMDKSERQDELYKIISEVGYASVEYLSRKTYQSQSTIRRDLDQLERAGLIVRRHGGAELAGNVTWLPLNSRIAKNHAAKLEIGKKAAALAKAGRTLFIDASSTCLEMARYLIGTPGIVVFTNGLEVASMLGNAGVVTSVIGGHVIPRSNAIAGEEAIIAASRINFDMLFFSSNGFADDIVTDYSEQETKLRQVLIERSEKKYFLCDKSKFGIKSTYVVCTRDDIDDVITEE